MQNIVAAVASQLKSLPKDHGFSEDDRVLSFAPFSDTIARTILFTALASGILILIHGL
jgi:hypothetical protein